MQLYNDAHSAFVSNLKGTSAGCVLICLLHVPVSILLLKSVQKASAPSYFRDFAYLVTPILLSVTLLADYGYFTSAILLLVGVLKLRRNKGSLYSCPTFRFDLNCISRLTYREEK